MQKKLIMACMAIAAFAAFVAAPAAQGAVLTSGGTAVPVGTSITAKSTGNFTFTGGFNLICETAHIVGTVTSNANTVAAIVPVGSASIHNTGNTDCSSALGSLKVTVTSELCLHIAKGSDTVVITGCGGNVVFDLNVTGVSNCKYETASISGTVTTNSTPATLRISEQPAKEVGGSFFCPDEGRIDLDFDLYTTDGTGLTVS